MVEVAAVEVVEVVEAAAKEEKTVETVVEAAAKVEVVAVAAVKEAAAVKVAWRVAAAVGVSEVERCRHARRRPRANTGRGLAGRRADVASRRRRSCRRREVLLD